MIQDRQEHVNKVWKEGFIAAKQGKPANANPYSEMPEPFDMDAWASGWASWQKD